MVVVCSEDLGVLLAPYVEQRRYGKETKGQTGSGQR